VSTIIYIFVYRTCVRPSFRLGHRDTVVGIHLGFSDGRGRCGVYCAANACIEQVIQHGEVDVFQAVKTVRRHRPQLIENMVNITPYAGIHVEIVLLLLLYPKAFELYFVNKKS